MKGIRTRKRVILLTAFILLMVLSAIKVFAQEDQAEVKKVEKEVKEELMVAVENMILDPVLPVAVIGTKMDGQVNFMTAAWFARIELDPYLFGVSIQKKHFTHEAIMKNKTFSINIPATDLLPQVDAVGTVSGNEYDKSEVFDVFFGQDKSIPLIEGSMVSFECEMVDAISLTEKDEAHPRAHTLFIGKVKKAWASKDTLDENGFNFQKKGPIFWSWSPLSYWGIGGKLGESHNPDNKKLVPKKEVVEIELKG